MAKKIKGTDIIEKDHLSNAIDQAKQLLKVYKSLGDQIKKNAQNIKSSVQGADPTTAKGIKEISAALDKSNKAKKAANKLDKDRERIETKLSQLRTAKSKQNAILNEQAKRLAKAQRDEAKAILDSGDAYEKLKRNTNQAQLEFKKMAAQFGVNSKQAKKAKKEFEKFDNELREINQHAKDGRRDVGRYSDAIKGSVGQLRNFASALGVVGGVQLLTRTIRDAFNVVKNFDQANANLASVLGVNREEMAGLTQTAKDLGATTKFTASQVSELQLEFAKLGFTQEEIQNVTEATLQLASAAGTDLANAATITGSTLRAFNLDSSETQRVVDVMAKSFSTSSLDIDKFKTAMGAVAPVAAAANVSVEETTALLGTLTDAGIDASTAGTGLRNVFLELTKKGMTFEEGMQEIAESSDKSATALDLFGKRGATIGLVLSQNSEKVGELTSKLEASAGAAGEMADKQLDTLQGSLDLLRSAWEGYILGADGASGASEKLKKIVKFLADNLDTILDTVIDVVKVWGLYKVAMNAAKVANNLFGGSLGKLKSAFGLVGIAILGVIEVFQGFKQQWEEANAIQNKFIEIQDKVNSKMDEEISKMSLLRDQILKTNAGSKERQELIDKINAEYGTTLENISDETAFMNQLNIAYEQYIKNLDRKINMQVLEEQIVDATKSLMDLRRQQDQFGSDLGIGTASKFQEGIEDTEKSIALMKQQLFALQQTGEQAAGTLKTNLTPSVKDFGKESEEAGKKAKKAGKDIKDAFDPENFDDEIGFFDDAQFLDFDENKVTIPFEIDDEGYEEAVRKIEELERLERERQERLLKSFQQLAENTKQIIETIAQDQINAIDQSINKLNADIQDSQSVIGELREQARLGNTDAAESLKAERIAQARDKAEIERLEKKKRNLLITISALNQANNFFQQGSLDGYKKAKANVTNFIKELPTFYEGTEGTVAEALGRTGVKDGHQVRVHDNEHIISAKDSDRLHKAGIYKNRDIVNGALAYNDLMSSKALIRRNSSQFSDQNIVKKLNDVEKSIKNIRIVQQHIDLASGKEMIVDGNKVVKNDHRPKTFRI